MDPIRNQVIVETKAESVLGALKAGTVGANVQMRKLVKNNCY